MAEQQIPPLKLHALQLDQVILEQCSVRSNYLKLKQSDLTSALTVEPRKIATQTEITGADSFIFRLLVDLAVKAKRRNVITIQLQLAGLGTSRVKVSPEMLEKFLGEAGVFLLWPYVRMNVGIFTQMTGTKPVPVPLIEIPNRLAEERPEPAEVKQ